ncbi:MAG: Hsp20/alpha crystallin family protein [Chrysiogenales bacterium]|nr:MAG: Hsp20/alpha crystallin family protein [Chrysiogenales bacterium]
MKWGIARLNNSNYGLSSIIDEICRMEGGYPDVTPRLDIMEDEHSFHVKAEIAGIDEKDLSVTLHDGIVTIAGEKKNERSEADTERNCIHSERVFGSFSRSITLPEGIDPEAVQARYVNGVLDIELKKSETARPRKIEVSVN